LGKTTNFVRGKTNIGPIGVLIMLNVASIGGFCSLKNDVKSFNENVGLIIDPIAKSFD
jgi:hypothetical protein